MNQSQLKTTFSLTSFESRNKPSFNAEPELEALKSNSKSVIPPGLLKKDSIQIIVDQALDLIHAKEETDLCMNFRAHNCNKGLVHNYPPLYYSLLNRVKDAPLTFLEVGIGSPNEGVPSRMSDNYSFGSSLRGWRDFFCSSQTQVIGADVDPRVMICEERIKSFYLNQLSPSAITSMINAAGLNQSLLDICIDDGLHRYESNLTLAISVWPYLKRNGIYIIEDIAKEAFELLMDYFKKAAFGASVAFIELPSRKMSDNRVIILQKY